MEKFQSHPEKEARMNLESRARKIRSSIIEDFKVVETFQDEVYEWNKQLKATLQEKGIPSRYLQQVAGWQALIGGTVEPETDISEEIKSVVEHEVETFISQQERQLGL